jgi:hypothetical protein
MFTEDVVFMGPHLALDSLTAVQETLGSPEDSLTDIEIIVTAVNEVQHKVIGEWRLEAMFTRPVLFNEELLIEPTGGAVCMMGASVAEFRDDRISMFRHYFDDSELMVGVPGTPSHLRWTSEW